MAADLQGEPSTNGHDESHAAAVMRLVRRQPRAAALFRGFGSLVAGVVLFVLMLLLAPSVAPERVVERPAGGTSSTTSTTAAPTTTTAAPATSVTP